MQKTISKQGSVQRVYIDRLNTDLKQNMIKRKMEDIKMELTEMKNTIILMKRTVNFKRWQQKLTKMEERKKRTAKNIEPKQPVEQY